MPKKSKKHKIDRKPQQRTSEKLQSLKVSTHRQRWPNFVL